MKKPRILTVIFLIICMIPVCSAASSSHIDTILERGVLVVGTTGHYPPLTVESENGELMGLDIDIAKLMAKAMGVQVKFKKIGLGALIPALEKGSVDMIIAGLTITPRRNLRVAFIGPYFVIGQSLLTLKSKIKSIKGPDDVNDPSFRLAVANNTTGAQVARTLVPRADIVKAANMDDALKMLLDKKVDALLADQPFCVVSAFLHKDKGLATSDPLTFEPLGIGLPGNDVLFLNWVQNFLMMLEANGQAKELKNYWFNDPSWMNNLPDSLKGRALPQPVI